MNLQMLNNKYMYKHKMNIYREIEIKQEDLSTKKGLSSIANDVPCRISQKKADANTGAEINTVSETFKLFTSIKVDIKAGDMAEVNGKRYAVGEPFKYEGHQELILTRKAFP